jgi:hypothetical protein
MYGNIWEWLGMNREYMGMVGNESGMDGNTGNGLE